MYFTQRALQESSNYFFQFDSLYKVPFLRVPTLFISGLADTLVPPQMMTELYSRCGSIRKQLLQIPAGTHNETWSLQGYYHSLAVFLQSCRMHKLESNYEGNKEECLIPVEKLWSNVQEV